MQRRISSQFLLSAIALLYLVHTANATPYASGVSVSAGNVTFILNESADNVTVFFDGGASFEDLGARAKGTHAFSLGSATTFQIVVKKDSAAGFTQGAIQQISSDANPLMRFNSPRGVSVNKNPSSAAFGRIFVANSTPGTTSGRSLGRGIYALNADQTEHPVLGTNALTGGIAFTNSANSPFRVTVGPDDMLYIADWSDASGSLYVTDMNVANGQNVFSGPTGGVVPVGTDRIHGSIAASWIEGSLAAGNLTIYVIDEDLQDDRTASPPATHINSIWRWDIGAGPLPTTATPTRIPSGLVGSASQVADITRGPDGKFYVSQRRQNDSFDNVIVRSEDASQALWNSKAKTSEFNGATRDLLWQAVGIDVSPDGKWLAVLRADNNSITVLPLLDGIPDLTNRIVLATSPTTGDSRDISFDAAGNLYYVSSGQGLMRIFSPGGKTTATTGSDGTFTVIVEEVPKVSVSTADFEAFETGPDTALFRLTRTGDTSQPLGVDYALVGTATNGVDYDAVPLSATFAAGQTSIDILINPIDDTIAELQETVRLNLRFSTNYSLATPTNGIAYIADNEPTALRLSTTRTNMYEPLPGDVGTIVVTRLGDTNTDIFNVTLLISGTAAYPADFYLSANEFRYEFFQVTSNLTVHPVNDFEVEGAEFITLALADSHEYASDSANTISFRIRDDDRPARVLFSDDLNADTSGNWQMRFGANNGTFDARTSWGYDYSGDLLPLAPNTADGTTRGLKLEVNKDGTGSSAGINFYPIGQTFSGDYALRFDMYLSYGTAATTEHAIAGLNHTGNFTVRATQSTDTNNTTAGGDGVWINIVTDASNLRDYAAYTYPTPASLPQLLTNRAASALTSAVTRPPYAVAGSPGSTGSSRSWADVELAQVNGVVTLKINNNVIFNLVNTTPFSSGNIMIGHNDQFDSISQANSFVIFDNIRVVSLAFEITGVQFLPNNEIQIDFASPNGEAATAFSLQSRPALGTGSWANDSGAVITSVAPGQFRAVTTRGDGGERYYQIVK